MAKQEIVSYSYTCDICGNEISADTETPERSFSFEGKDYTIDVCDKDQKGLDRALSGLTSYVEVGHRRSVGRRSKQKRSVGGRRRSSGVADIPTIRAWARENGFAVSERGRIAADVQEAYAKASR